jgi:hypothetical protein
MFLGHPQGCPRAAAKVTHDGFAIQRLVGPHRFLFAGQLPGVFLGDPQVIGFNTKTVINGWLVVDLPL